MMQTVILGDQIFIPVKFPVEKAPRTFSGFYQKMKHGVRFFNRDMVLKFFLVAQGRSTCWFVTAGKLDNGRIFYMHGLDSVTAKWLDLEDDSRARAKGFSSAFSRKQSEAQRIWSLFTVGCVS